MSMLAAGESKQNCVRHGPTFVGCKEKGCLSHTMPGSTTYCVLHNIGQKVCEVPWCQVLAYGSADGYLCRAHMFRSSYSR